MELAFASSFDQDLALWSVDSGARTDDMLSVATAFQRFNAPWAKRKVFRCLAGARRAEGERDRPARGRL